jgi:hypothetical protein
MADNLSVTRHNWAAPLPSERGSLFCGSGYSTETFADHIGAIAGTAARDSITGDGVALSGRRGGGRQTRPPPFSRTPQLSPPISRSNLGRRAVP